jgi:hypothetical protein
MAITDSISTLEPLQTAHGEFAQDYRACILAAKLADTCVSASFLPDLWSVYYERFHGVLRAELVGDDTISLPAPVSHTPDY